MKYRIEYADSGCCHFAKDRAELLKCLGQLKSRTISDIRKLYKNGVSDSVMEKYESLISR